MMMKNMLDHLGIDEAEVSRQDSTDDKLYSIFDCFKDKIFFDNTKNFLNKRLFYEPGETLEWLKTGNGLNCQEMIFLLKEILLHFGIQSKIVHGDIYDFDLGVKKDKFLSILIVDMSAYFYHVDTLHKSILRVEKGKSLRNEDGSLEILDTFEDYYLVKKYENGINYYAEMIFMDIDERFRISRMERTYGDLSTVPFGIIAPLYWEVNPERKVFYNILSDKVRIVYGRNVFDLDLLEWDLHDVSNWLTSEQKQVVNRCIAEIIENIDGYMEIAQKAMPQIDSKVTRETFCY